MSATFWNMRRRRKAKEEAEKKAATVKPATVASAGADTPAKASRKRKVKTDES